MRFVMALMALFITTTTAMATPGDVGCYGIAGKKYAIDVLIGYDHFGQDAALLEVTVNGDKVFSSDKVTTGMVNMGTEDSPFINGLLYASDAQSYVEIRFPEDDGGNTFEAFLNLNIENGLTATDVLITCEI